MSAMAHSLPRLLFLRALVGLLTKAYRPELGGTPISPTGRSAQRGLSAPPFPMMRNTAAVAAVETAMIAMASQCLSVSDRSSFRLIEVPLRP